MSSRASSGTGGRGSGRPAGRCAGADVFVLPGTSGANRRHDYDGRVDRLSWWQDLADLAGRETPG